MQKNNKNKKEKARLFDALKENDIQSTDPNILEFEKEAQRIEQERIEEIKSENESEEALLVKNKENKPRKKNRFATLAACFVLLLAVGVGGNWYFENSSLGEKIKPILSSQEVKTLGQAQFVDATTVAKSENEYFTKARVDRQNSRDEALEKLQAVVDSPNVDKEESVNATNEIAKISKYISVENKVETLVCAKGVSNCLAVVSADGERIDIVVDSAELNDQVIMQIKDVAIEQLGCTFEDVAIIQAK